MAKTLWTVEQIDRKLEKLDKKRDDIHEELTDLRKKTLEASARLGNVVYDIVSLHEMRERAEK